MQQVLSFSRSSKLSHIVFSLFLLLMMPNESCKGKDEHRKKLQLCKCLETIQFHSDRPVNHSDIDLRCKVTSWVDKQLRTGLLFQVSLNSSPKLLEKKSGISNCSAQQPRYAAGMPKRGGLSGLISNFIVCILMMSRGLYDP